jgi:hypothetical protein
MVGFEGLSIFLGWLGFLWAQRCSITPKILGVVRFYFNGVEVENAFTGLRFFGDRRARRSVTLEFQKREEEK